MSKHPKRDLLPFFETEESDDWTFHGAPTRELTHVYHDYPARMIPQIAAKILDLYGYRATCVFDPYCGSGTSLVEGAARGIFTIGTDLNPLARLIATAKTTIPEVRDVECHFGALEKAVCAFSPDPEFTPPTLPGIRDLHFWFKPEVSEKLAFLKAFIKAIELPETNLFFKAAFSETVRECSNTRNEEFKLYRYEEARLNTFTPDVFGTMLWKLQRNLIGLKKFIALSKPRKNGPLAVVHDFNTVDGIPQDLLLNQSVDLVLTSPPYGDSRTTVAYGQYSRLSAAWLELPDPAKVDARLMGGSTVKNQILFPSAILNQAIEAVVAIDEKRGREVAAFYEDLRRSIRNIATVLKPGGYAAYVVGNRKVKGTVLPTDRCVADFFENEGFRYVTTHIRSIPNKRMPLKNSPTNIPGSVDATMTNEYIVVVQKI